jgi:hypothetical protein
MTKSSKVSSWGTDDVAEAGVAVPDPASELAAERDFEPGLVYAYMA